MPIIVGHRRIVGDVAGEIARLESLVAALDRIGGGGGMPTTAELEAAPPLDPYGLDTCTLPCLIGANRGHPTLKGPVIRTTEVWALAPELGWARTLSRLYPLQSCASQEGRSMHPGEQG